MCHILYIYIYISIYVCTTYIYIDIICGCGSPPVGMFTAGIPTYNFGLGGLGFRALGFRILGFWVVTSASLDEHTDIVAASLTASVSKTK